MENLLNRETAKIAVSGGCFLTDIQEGKQAWLEKFGNPPAFTRGRSFAVPLIIGKDGDVDMYILSGRIIKKGHGNHMMKVTGLREWFSGIDVDNKAQLLGLDDTVNLTGRIPSFTSVASPYNPEMMLMEKLRHTVSPKSDVGKAFSELYIKDWYYEFADTVPSEMTFEEWAEEAKAKTTAANVLSAIKENNMKEAYGEQPARLLYLEALEHRAHLEIGFGNTWEPDQFGKLSRLFENRIKTVPLVLSERNSRPSDILGQHPAICRISMMQPDGEGMVITKETPFGGKPEIRAYSFGEDRNTQTLKVDPETFGNLVSKIRDASSLRTESHVDAGGFHHPVEELDYEAGISTRESFVDPGSDAGKEIISDIKRLFDRNHIVTALDAFRADNPARARFLSHGR